MPMTSFTPENVRVSPTSFPKIKLGKGEKARLVCAETQPVYEWIHELKKPIFSKIGGKPVMEKRNRANGEEYETYKLDFIGRPICHGDPDILEDRGVDPDGCYACRFAKETDFISTPVRRYAIHALQYATETGSTRIAEPFSVACRVWCLTEKRFAEIVELMSDAKVIDPRKLDILLTQTGPETFQQYDMQGGRECELWASEERLRRGVLTYKENHAPDLSAYCGRAVDLRYLQEDVDVIVAAWRQVRAAESGEVVSSGVPERGVSEVDSSLLDMVGAPGSSAPPAKSAPAEDPWAEEAKPATAAAPPEEVPDGWEEFSPTTTSVTEEGAKTMATPSSVKPAPAAPAEGAVDFDDLLGKLGV